METLFPGYFRKTPEQIRNIWENCIFVFDANVLLNLYRYSPATTDSFIDVLRRIEDRIWLPWQAAHEFHVNRLNVIDKQTRTYGSTIDTTQKLQSSLENPREHPFIDSDKLVRISSALTELSEHLRTMQDSRRRLLHDDPRLIEISKLFQGKIGQEPEASTRSTWATNAKARYEQKIPPGFRDAPKEGERAYGDAFIWFEIMAHAKTVAKDIVFITDDAKNDWWLEVSGETVGPLPVLVQEFTQNTKNNILFYRPDRFVGYAFDYLKRRIDPGVVDEIRNQTKRQMLYQRLAPTHMFERDEHIAPIIEHALVHIDAVRELQNISQSYHVMLSGLSKIKLGGPSPSLLASKIQDLVKRCPCLVQIVLDLISISNLEFTEAMEAYKHNIDRETRKLLTGSRHLPKQIVNELRDIRNHRAQEALEH